MIESPLLEDLYSKKSLKRRHAAKIIGENKLYDLAESLFHVYLKEKKDNRTWETQVSMILALGLVDYKPALPDIESIVRLNKPHDMITYAAAQTYVRICRKSIHDAQPIIKLLKSGGLSLVDGALNPLAYDRMMPPSTEIKELIQLCWNLNEHPDRINYERNYCDPRYGLAAACAGWNDEITRPFLIHCLNSAGNDVGLKYVAESSLKKKYPRLR
jgi:hypothetical protein